MPIRCIVQETACQYSELAPDSECNVYEKECDPGHFCIATGHYVNDKAHRAYANCFQADVSDCPGTDECVSMRNDEHNYCCCKESLCNKIYKIEPERQSDEITTSPMIAKSQSTGELLVDQYILSHFVPFDMLIRNFE
jgi:hypothetical protein